LFQTEKNRFNKLAKFLNLAFKFSCIQGQFILGGKTHVPNLCRSYKLFCGPGSVVGTTTDYGFDGPGFESFWGRDFPHLSRPAMGLTQPPVNGYRVFPGVKERPGLDADPSPPSSAVDMKE